MLQHVRTAFIENKPRITNNENKNILVIKRKKGRRSYSGHDLLLIQLDTVSKHVRIFEGNSTLEDHIQLSTGQMLSLDRMGPVFPIWFSVRLNTPYCNRMGWYEANGDGNMYSRVSAALGLHYILLIGRGSYDGNISLNPFKIISEIKFY